VQEVSHVSGYQCMLRMTTADFSNSQIKCNHLPTAVMMLAEQNRASDLLLLLYNYFTTLWIVWDNSGEPVTESPTHTYCGHQLSLICFFHLLQSMASSVQ